MRPRTTLNGEALAPVLPKVAAAQADGRIGGEHVAVIRRFFDRLPTRIDVGTRQQCETDLVRAAVGLDPDALRKVADRLTALIDQDGPESDDTDHARKRLLTLGRQRRVKIS